MPGNRSLYSIDLIVSVGKELTVVGSLVMKARYIQGIIGFKGSIETPHCLGSTRSSMIGKSFLVLSWYYSRVDLGTMFSQSKYSYFTMSTTTSHAFVFINEITPFNFHFAIKLMTQQLESNQNSSSS